MRPDAKGDEAMRSTEHNVGDRVLVIGLGVRTIVRYFADADGIKRATVQCQAGSQDDVRIEEIASGSPSYR